MRLPRRIRELERNGLRVKQSTFYLVCIGIVIALIVISYLLLK